MTTRGPERKKLMRNLAYGGAALMLLAIDGVTAYANIRGFMDGKFTQAPEIPIILDTVILLGNAGVIWGLTHPSSPIRNMLGGYDEPPNVIQRRSQGFFRHGRNGDRPDRDILN